MDLGLGGGRHTAPTTGFGRAIHQRASELSCRAVAERLVRLRLVVVLQPLLRSADHSCGIGPRMDAHVVWLEGLHEGGPEGWRGGALRVADRLRWRGDLLDRHHAECAHDSPSLQRLLNPSGHAHAGNTLPQSLQRVGCGAIFSCGSTVQEIHARRTDKAGEKQSRGPGRTSSRRSIVSPATEVTVHVARARTSRAPAIVVARFIQPSRFSFGPMRLTSPLSVGNPAVDRSDDLGTR